MTFLSGPSTNPVVLLDTFVAMLGTAGWVQDAYVADGTGKRYHGHKGAKFIHLRSFINEAGQPQLGTISFGGSGIAAIGSIGYSGTAGFWYAHTGAPVQLGLGMNTARTCIMSLPAGAITNSWMFTDVTGDNAVIIALNAFGVYTYLYFGDIEKVQAWTGGMYFGGSRPSNGAFGFGIEAQESGPPGDYLYVRADVDSFVGLWLSNNADTGKTVDASVRSISRSQIFQGQGIGWGTLRLRARSEITAGLLMLPVLLVAERDFGGVYTGGGLSLIGSVPHVFQTTITGFSPGSTVSIGPDQYQVFPQFAVRKIP